jgi:hypothetical protein
MQWGGPDRMYHPYFRGKQFDLLTIRETAPLLSQAGFRPIIEPVRDVLGGLNKSLDAVIEAGGRAVVIVNPHHGDLSGAGTPLSDLLKDKFLDMPGISAGILLKHDMSTAEALSAMSSILRISPFSFMRDLEKRRRFLTAWELSPRIGVTSSSNVIVESCI